MKQMPIDELLHLEDNWLDQEIFEEGEERNTWIEEGIQLYEQFRSVDKREPRYAITLADLYLQLGRDEKMRRGNQQSAYTILRNATIYNPTKPDAFYHLSFIVANRDRQWEAVIFYGREALEKGISGSKRVKLLCNVALGYARLGYIQQAMEHIAEAYNLDKLQEQHWFIELYLDRIKSKVKEPILLKEAQAKRRYIARQDTKQLKEDAAEGKCLVLDLTEEQRYFYGCHDTVRLERREADVLGYLMEHQATSCSKLQIEEAVWLERQVSASAVKRYVGAVRKRLSQAMGRDDVAVNLLITTDQGYEWRPDIPSIVLRR